MKQYFLLSVFSLSLFLVPGWAIAGAVNPELYTSGKEAFESRNCELAIKDLTQFKNLNSHRIPEHPSFFDQIDEKIDVCRDYLSLRSDTRRVFGGAGKVAPSEEFSVPNKNIELKNFSGAAGKSKGGMILK